MINGKTVAVVMPAFRAEQTLEATWRAIPEGVVDQALLVDDASDDDTVRLAERLGIEVVVHERNQGYGANQKTCYRTILARDPDIVVMLHPDYQYDPRLLTSMVGMIASGVYEIVIGSRILAGGALKGGMPLWKYVANRGLTAFQNLLLGAKLSEYHTGYRAFTREVLEKLPLENNSDNFLFDNQMLAQVIYAGFDIGEITCPTRYDDDSSSISFIASARYGLGVVITSLAFCCHKWGLRKSKLFSPLD